MGLQRNVCLRLLGAQSNRKGMGFVHNKVSNHISNCDDKYNATLEPTGEVMMPKSLKLNCDASTPY